MTSGPPGAAISTQVIEGGGGIVRTDSFETRLQV
jgi:hypothetical protein